MSNVSEIYSLRKSFSIIGLTGRTACGCSDVADRLKLTRDEFLDESNNQYRDRESIEVDNIDFQLSLFKRKYSIVQNFVSKNWNSYQVIDYKKVLFFYLIYSIKDEQYPLNKILNLFKETHEEVENKLAKEFDLQADNFKKILNDGEFLNTIKCFNELEVELLEINKESDLNIIYKIFFNDAFSNLYKQLTDQLNEVNYFYKVFLFDKIGESCRKYKVPIGGQGDGDKSHIYTVVSVINKIIKSYKLQSDNRKNCHIVIDSFKSSLEIMFFKERYSAFYIASIHNEDGYVDRIKDKIIHEDLKEITLDKVIEFDSLEYDSKNFSKGKFYSADVQNCIQKGEIHLQFKKEIDLEKYDFYTLTEQLMKIQALILQPGIITPTNVERCMQIAYNSKFNSGCISRQVGAVITDSTFAIKAVGWNDVPKNTMACLFRSVNDIKEEKNDIAYSKFENIKNEYSYKHKIVKGITTEGETVKIVTNLDFSQKNFAENLLITLQPILSKVEEDGKNCSFCFKSNHNLFEGEKNQVHTRSLHAEENAMLQISKHGGQKLSDGVLFTTASPCELCAKKAFQLGIKDVYYIDIYPGISEDHVLKHGVNAPELKPFIGVIGTAFNKLYEPFMSYKDELDLYK